MTVNMFIAAAALGSAALALWVEVRFPKLGPDRVVWGVFHLLAASMGAQILVPTALDAAGNKMLAIFVVAIPALIYVFLAAIWIMKLARGALGSAYR